MVWVLFIFVAAVIVFAGSRLSGYADILAIKLKLSRSAMGVLLVSIVTTLPEITTTLSAICKVDAPNMALGNNFGSILFNLSIIAICDCIFRRGGILRHINSRELKPALYSLTLILLSAFALLLPMPIAIGGMRFGAGSLVVIIVFVFFFMRIHSSGQVSTSANKDEKEVVGENVSLRTAIIGFAVCSILIVICGVSLAVIGDNLAKAAGLSSSFVGTLFLAIATSLPELTVGISSVRRGAYDLMLGNIMGANMLNVVVIALADLFYIKDALNVPKNLGWGQVFAAACAILVTGVVISGILKKSQMRASRFIGWRSVVILLVHVVCLIVIFNGWL